MQPTFRRFAVQLAFLKRLVFNPAAITAATIGVTVALFAAAPLPLELVELNWLDLRFRARGPLAPGPAVVVAAIDEKSLAAEGRWPWPRSRIAALVDALSRDGAKVIGFDVLFSETEEDARLALIGELERAVDAQKINNATLKKLLRESRTAADHDRMLASALKRSSAPVVLGYFFHMSEESVGFRLDAPDIARRLEAIGGSKYPLVYQDPQGKSAPFIKAYAPQTNLGMFTAAAASSGYFSVASDPDGVVRWMPLMVQGGEDFFPPLAVLCVWHYLGKPPLAVRSGPYGVDGVQIGEQFVPTDESGRLFINFRGPAQAFPTYSISDILQGKLASGTFKDKIVIVGATAIGIGDIRTTAFGPLFPGPEVHANAIDNILAGDFIERPRWAKVFDLSAIIALGLVVGLMLPRTSALFGLLFSGGLFVTYLLGAYWLFAKERVGVSLVYPVFAVAATYTMLTLYRYLTEERERRRITGAFQHYVAPDVIEVMLKDPAGLRLGGEERVLTALLSDLEGFTSFSEHHTPNEVISVLSDYYAQMTDEVFAVQGTLVEYVGDEMFALYGAPVTQPDHAKRACASALAMQAHRNALGDEWEKIGRPRIKARTGINTGNMLVGNIGSKYRFHYGAMGDAVNLASRLEGLNKIYGTQIIVSGDTADLVASEFRLRELDMVRVKGRKQALRIYELISTADMPVSTEQKELMGLYEAGLGSYREQRWEEALELFTKCLLIRPEDGPSRLMARRSRSYRDEPPAEGWDGTFVDRRGQHAK
jgi:adenylate cyclase